MRWVWAHEALQLFQDRLVSEEERLWTDQNIDAVAQQHFPAINFNEALAHPILFLNWMSRYYVPVDREQLCEFTKARLEEFDVPLVLFNDVLYHAFCIYRVFCQIQGHLLLIGVSGSGKVCQPVSDGMFLSITAIRTHHSLHHFKRMPFGW